MFQADNNHLMISGSSGALQINLWAYPCWPENSLQCTFGQWEALFSKADSYKALPSLKGTTRSSSACNIRIGTSITCVKKWKLLYKTFKKPELSGLRRNPGHWLQGALWRTSRTRASFSTASPLDGSSPLYQHIIIHSNIIIHHSNHPASPSGGSSPRRRCCWKGIPRQEHKGADPPDRGQLLGHKFLFQVSCH